MSWAKSREGVVAAGIGGLLFFVPLFRAGNRPLPLMILELGALGLLLLCLWPPMSRGEIKAVRLPLAIAALVFCYPLLYLIPVPIEFWASLPGRAPYSQALGLLDGSGESWRPVALVPALTESAWLALLPPLAVFVAALSLPTSSLRALIALAVGIGVGEAVLGLMQYGAGRASLFCLGNPYCGESATGTYVNRNHLAGLLEMMLVIGLSLTVATLGRVPKVRRYRRSWRERLLSLSTWRGHLATLYGAASITLLLGLIFTRSRAGVTLAMLGILLSLFVFAGRLGGTNVFGVIGTLSAVGLALAVEIGLAPVLQRFTLDDAIQDSRWTIFASTLQGIGSFFPLGSGPGTFPEAHRQFQPLELGHFSINHVHNDYLEWVFEGGLVASVILLVLLVLYLRQWLKLWTAERQWTTFRFIQAGAGIGLMLIALHGCVDFNWHIPANALYTGFLAGVFFHVPEIPLKQLPDKHSGRRGRGGDAEYEAPGIQSSESSVPVTNPFLEYGITEVLNGFYGAQHKAENERGLP